MDLKCKMCGGTIEFEEGSTIGVCDSCGTKQTLPLMGNDRKQNLLDRAGHFLLNHDFNKAMMLYEQALSEDKQDAEVYWRIVLCRYGIEYVEDPTTHKRIPTIHRSQYKSVFADKDYQNAMKYGDMQQKQLYEEEAGKIEQIQKEILELSNKEEPYDVFICYKENDENGNRTKDSVLANELYHELKEEGFRVFYAKISLENMLGKAYEPVIFAALNSAKVMVVIGTKAEYLNSVWVKNEWSRYLKMIEEGEEKVLIPAYRDMDPYDLPEEFSHLQAQDMSKLGFMQDLIWGIKKLTIEKVQKKTVIKEEAAAESVNIETFLKRVKIFLEDGEWKRADEYCEKILDKDPENGRAYLGKMMAERHIRKEEDLKESRLPFDKDSNYQRILRFADEELVNRVKEVNEFIKKRNEEAQNQKVYEEASKLMEAAKTEEEYKNAAQEFDKITGYKDAEALALQCKEKAEESRKDLIYDNAILNMKGKDPFNYRNAIKELEKIDGWKDSVEKIKECQERIRVLEEEEKRETAEFERIRKKREKWILRGLILVFVAGITIGLFNTVIIPGYKYHKAMKLIDEGHYIAARKILVELEDCKSCSEQAASLEEDYLKEKYREAEQLLEAEDYENAYAVFINLKGYDDSRERAHLIYTEHLRKKRENGSSENEKSAKDLEEAIKYKNAKIESFRNASVGDIVTLGTYEQDNDRSNGKEEVEWIVLDKEEDRILVISRYVIDTHYFNVRNKNVTWEESSMHYWLDHGFIRDTFGMIDETMILGVTVPAEKNPYCESVDPGADTVAKVFLLSVQEVDKYFGTKEAMKCQGTAYSRSQGLFVNEETGNCYWWLRSPGNEGNVATAVDIDDSYAYAGILVDCDLIGVRPAMWLNLNPE